MKKGDLGTNGSDLNKNNIIKSTLDHLSKEDRKELEAYHKGLIQKDAAPINIYKSKVTPKVQSNPSLSLNDVQAMINFALERQAKSSNEMIRSLVEERDGKKHVDSNVHTSSSCVVNFVQTNPQPTSTSTGSTSQPNPSAQPMSHFYNRTTIDGSAPTCGMPQQTTTGMFR
jgi:hypothetical protein